MKNEIRTLLLRDPMMTMPDVAKALGKDPQNNKNVVIAYWKARSLLMEELTGETIGTLLDKDLIGTVYNDKDRKNPMENRDPADYRDRKDLAEEQGPYRDPIHSVSDRDRITEQGPYRDRIINEGPFMEQGPYEGHKDIEHSVSNEDPMHSVSEEHSVSVDEDFTFDELIRQF